MSIYACVFVYISIYPYACVCVCVLVCVYVSQLSAVNEGADGRTSLYSSRDGSTPLTGSTSLAATGTLSPFFLP